MACRRVMGNVRCTGSNNLCLDTVLHLCCLRCALLQICNNLAGFTMNYTVSSGTYDVLPYTVDIKETAAKQWCSIGAKQGGE